MNKTTSIERKRRRRKKIFRGYLTKEKNGISYGCSNNEKSKQRENLLYDEIIVSKRWTTSLVDMWFVIHSCWKLGRKWILVGIKHSTMRNYHSGTYIKFTWNFELMISLGKKLKRNYAKSNLCFVDYVHSEWECSPIVSLITAFFRNPKLCPNAAFSNLKLKTTPKIVPIK